MSLSLFSLTFLYIQFFGYFLLGEFYKITLLFCEMILQIISLSTLTLVNKKYLSCISFVNMLSHGNDVNFLINLSSKTLQVFFICMWIDSCISISLCYWSCYFNIFLKCLVFIIACFSFFVSSFKLTKNQRQLKWQNSWLFSYESLMVVFEWLINDVPITSFEFDFFSVGCHLVIILDCCNSWHPRKNFDLD